ncbi:hypothetical protein V8C44DRAFT_319449 [Trichoderma aethiopicum]
MTYAYWPDDRLPSSGPFHRFQHLRSGMNREERGIGTDSLTASLPKGSLSKLLKIISPANRRVSTAHHKPGSTQQASNASYQLPGDYKSPASRPDRLSPSPRTSVRHASD